MTRSEEYRIEQRVELRLLYKLLAEIRPRIEELERIIGGKWSDSEEFAQEGESSNG